MYTTKACRIEFHFLIREAGHTISKEQLSPNAFVGSILFSSSSRIMQYHKNDVADVM